jgi:hypothetical protein
MDTSGFYKLDGTLLYGYDSVVNRDYELYRDRHTTYPYPVDGWHWFDSRDEALAFFGIEEEAHAPEFS